MGVHDHQIQDLSRKLWDHGGEGEGGSVSVRVPPTFLLKQEQHQLADASFRDGKSSESHEPLGQVFCLKWSSSGTIIDEEIPTQSNNIQQVCICNVLTSQKRDKPFGTLNPNLPMSYGNLSAHWWKCLALSLSLSMCLALRTCFPLHPRRNSSGCWLAFSRGFTPLSWQFLQPCGFTAASWPS